MNTNNENNVENIYINMDDSGRLVKGEKEELVFVYGGVFFLSLKEQEDFSRKYKALVNLIKHKSREPSASTRPSEKFLRASPYL